MFGKAYEGNRTKVVKDTNFQLSISTAAVMYNVMTVANMAV